MQKLLDCWISVKLGERMGDGSRKNAFNLYLDPGNSNLILWILHGFNNHDIMCEQIRVHNTK